MTRNNKQSRQLKALAPAANGKLTQIAKNMAQRMYPPGAPSSARSSTRIEQNYAPASKGARVRASNRPKFGSSERGIIVKHSEMIGSLISSGTTLTYGVTEFVINPGKSSTFPWLSTIAGNFDKYRMHKLKVHLVSSQPTSTAGRIGVGIDYDSTDAPPADRVEFFNLTHHAECAAWDSIVFDVPLQPTEKFVNSHTTTDSKLIDMGQIIVMSDQIVATSAILADIIVEYHVELIEPQQAVLSTMTLTGANPASFSALTVTGPVVGTLIPTTSTTVLEMSLPAGTYLVSSHLLDSGTGSPGLIYAVHGGTGGNRATNSTTINEGSAIVKITTNDGTFRWTFNSVAIANLENILIFVTRVSPTLFASAVASYASAITTY
nr:MAG: putative coat protein [Tombusviridae sp.]